MTLVTDYALLLSQSSISFECRINLKRRTARKKWGNGCFPSKYTYGYLYVIVKVKESESSAPRKYTMKNNGGRKLK
jgi:hypothetical protein